MGSLEMFSTSKVEEKIIQNTPSFPITAIIDNRNKTNSNEKSLELISKIFIKDIPIIIDKYLTFISIQYSALVHYLLE